MSEANGLLYQADGDKEEDGGLPRPELLRTEDVLQLVKDVEDLEEEYLEDSGYH